MDAEETETRSLKRKIKEVIEDESSNKKPCFKVDEKIPDESSNYILSSGDTPELIRKNRSDTLKYKNLEENKLNTNNLDTIDLNSVNGTNVFVNDCKQELELYSIKQCNQQPNNSYLNDDTTKNDKIPMDSDEQELQPQTNSAAQNDQELQLDSIQSSIDNGVEEKLNCDQNDNDSVIDPQPMQVNSNVDITNVNNDDDSNQVSSTTVHNIPREKCKYGDQCYRHNIQHKAKFSHPGDPDYNIPDNRLECPYGIKCYRKNPQHKLDYKHTRNKRKPKPPLRPSSPIDLSDFENSEEESIDESDYDPSFIDDESLDEWESDFENENEDE